MDVIDDPRMLTETKADQLLATRLAVPTGVGREEVARIAGAGYVAGWLTREGRGFQIVWHGKEQRVFYADRDDAHEALVSMRADALLALLSYAEAGGVEGRYLVWSNEHEAWWGKDRCGYTRVIERAGRYDRAEALSIAGTRDGGWHVRKGNPDEIAIPEQDAIDQYAAITRTQDAASPAAVAGGDA